MGAGGDQLLAGAAAGEHRDADGAGGQRALDVVHVVADVDRGALAAQRVGLADAPHPALEVVDVEGQVVEVELGVGGVLAGDDHDAAGVPAYGGDRLVRAVERGRARDRVVGVERAEPVARGRDRLGGEVGLEQQVERRPELGRHLLDRELDAELGAQRRQHVAEAGRGVDQRHVEVEPDDQLICHHGSSA